MSYRRSLFHSRSGSLRITPTWAAATAAHSARARFPRWGERQQRRDRAVKSRKELQKSLDEPNAG